MSFYNTKFSGHLIDHLHLEQTVAIAISQLDEFEHEWKDTIPTCINDVLQKYPLHWDTWREELEALSERFPGVTIDIHGEGDEWDDIWNARFRNGESTAVFLETYMPPIDEGNLKKYRGEYYNEDN